VDEARKHGIEILGQMKAPSDNGGGLSHIIYLFCVCLKISVGIRQVVVLPLQQDA
jgi:hypothetical protein